MNPSSRASERAPASERPSAACVAGNAVEVEVIRFRVFESTPDGRRANRRLYSGRLPDGQHLRPQLGERPVGDGGADSPAAAASRPRCAA